MISSMVVSVLTDDAVRPRVYSRSVGEPTAMISIGDVALGFTSAQDIRRVMAGLGTLLAEFEAFDSLGDS